jgi:hypothetical protein
MVLGQPNCLLQLRLAASFEAINSYHAALFAHNEINQ